VSHDGRLVLRPVHDRNARSVFPLAALLLREWQCPARRKT